MQPMLSALALLLLFFLSSVAWPQAGRSTDASHPAAAAAQPGNVPAAVPARPTVSTPAELPPPGYLQFEQGLLEAANSPGEPAVDKQFSLVQNTKLALNRRILIQALDQPFAHSSFSQGPASNDTGDLQLGAQLVLVDHEEGQALKPTLAVAYTGLVRAGTSANLDTGGYKHSAMVLMSGNVAGVHYDANAIFNDQQGQDASGREIRRAQFGQVVAISRQVTSAFSVAAELWHFTQPLVSTTRDGAFVPRANAVGSLFAAGYTLRPNLVLDAGFDHGLTSTSTAWEGFAGFTYLLPHRLW